MKTFSSCSAAAAVIACMSLAGCSLPNGGPLAGTVQETRGTAFVKVTPALANQMVLESRKRQRALLDAALAALSGSYEKKDYRLHPGDDIQVALWTFSSLPGQVQSTSDSGGPAPLPLGNYQLDVHGNVSLPYVRNLHLAGLTGPQAEQTINHSYESLHLLQSPSATVTIAGGLQSKILVTGAVEKPGILPWNPGGVTMAEALTLSLGNASMTSPSASTLSHQTATTVSVYRAGQNPVTIPIANAMENTIALQPGDKLIVHSQPTVQTLVLGGGATRTGSYSFGEVPSLAQVLAQAQGLNPNAANAQHIFVFRQSREDGSILYDLNFNSGVGILTAQAFPIEDRDIVYVAESPIVPVSRVLNTIFQMALPATLAR